MFCLFLSGVLDAIYYIFFENTEIFGAYIKKAIFYNNKVES